MDITVYLIELLRLHDCVIVPELGGFVTNYRPAEMDLANNAFNPPKKEIIFSSKLNKNDGLLVNHISETEGIGYIEARLIVSEFVEEVVSKLENGMKIELLRIGSLYYDRNEKLIFESEIHENFLLDAFGLDGFQFPQIRHNELFITKRLHRDKESVRPVFITRRVKRLLIGIPILLALMIIPVTRNSWNNFSFRNNQISGAASIELNESLPSNVKPPLTSIGINPVTITEPLPEIGNTSVLAIPQKNEKAAQVSKMGASQSKYHLIGGCFIMKENADKLFSNLISRGYQSKLDQLPNGKFIVTIQSYSDRDEAYLALNLLHEKEPNAGYWMRVK